LPSGYHRQYLYKVPDGHCELGGTNVKLGYPSRFDGISL
jgi:hypothetical protein